MSANLQVHDADGDGLAGVVGEACGYRFRDASLLEQALTLASWHDDARPGSDNQRLEFLGDAAIGLLAAEHLYAAHPGLDEGGMSLLRTRVTSGRALAEVARRIGLGRWLRMGRSDELTGGGREREGALADTLEALFGAVWIDGGLEAARGVYRRLLADLVSIADVAEALRNDNPKGRLQERSQAADGSIPVYEVVDTSGSGHQPRFTVRVTLCSGLTAVASGSSKRAAETAAALGALAALDAAHPATAGAVDGEAGGTS